MVNSSTIYLSQIEDIIQQDGKNKIIVTDKSNNLSKKVAQNRAAQRAFRERKQHYINELETKVKQLDVWKRAVIQLQADNECLRRTITDLESQLKQVQPSSSDSHPTTTTSTSTSLNEIKVEPIQEDEQEKVKEEQNKIQDHSSSSSCIPIQMISSTSSLTIPNDTTTINTIHPSHPHHSSINNNSNTIQINHHTTTNNNNNNNNNNNENNNIKRKSTLSKREKKRQRLLEDEKLYKYDDFEPIQLHCPTSITPLHFNSINIPTHLNQPESYYDDSIHSSSSSSSNSVVEEPSITLDESTLFLLSSPPSSVISSTSNAFDHHDQYINFIDDNVPSSSSSTSTSTSNSSCSSPFLSLF